MCTMTYSVQYDAVVKEVESEHHREVDLKDCHTDRALCGWIAIRLGPVLFGSVRK